MFIVVIIITSVLLIKLLVECYLPASVVDGWGELSDMVICSSSCLASSYTCSGVEIRNIIISTPFAFKYF